MNGTTLLGGKVNTSKTDRIQMSGKDVKLPSLKSPHISAPFDGKAEHYNGFLAK